MSIPSRPRSHVFWFGLNRTRILAFIAILRWKGLFDTYWQADTVRSSYAYATTPSKQACFSYCHLNHFNIRGFHIIYSRLSFVEPNIDKVTFTFTTRVDARTSRVFEELHSVRKYTIYLQIFTYCTLFTLCILILTFIYMSRHLTGLLNRGYDHPRNLHNSWLKGLYIIGFAY